MGEPRPVTVSHRKFCLGASALWLLPAIALGAEVSLTGEGGVRYNPDSARLSFTINAEHPDADAATEQVRDIMEEWRENIADYRNDLVDYSDASMHLYQRQRSPEPRQASGEPPEMVVVASQTISFEIHDLDLLNPLLAEAQALGLNYSLGQQQFFHSEQDKFQQEALAKAIRNARERCEFAATQLDMSCGEVKTLDLHTDSGGPILMRMRESADSAGAVSEVGPREVKATVSATFSLE